MLLMSQTQPLAAFSGAVLVSLMTGGVSALCSALIGDRVAEEWRGRSLGLLYTLRDLGATVGPPTALALTPLLGLGNVFALHGCSGGGSGRGGAGDVGARAAQA